MKVLHQKLQVNTESPLQVYITDVQEFPPHWHEIVEIIYALEDELKVGVSQTIYTLKKRDICIVSGGEVHSFPIETRPLKRLIVQFHLSHFEGISPILKDKRFSMVLRNNLEVKNNNKSEKINQSQQNITFGGGGVYLRSHMNNGDGFFARNLDSSTDIIPKEKRIDEHINDNIHHEMETLLLALQKENTEKNIGYKLALKARVFDLLILILRNVPMESLSDIEKNKQMQRLERLEIVLRYVDEHFENTILLDDVAKITNFSVFHFSRFFKETTGITFCQYVNQYRIAKSVDYLLNTEDTITEIVFQSGFNNAKTFNRLFKQMKGCSPTVFKDMFSNKT